MEVNEKEFKDDHLLDNKYDVFKFNFINQNIERNIDFKKWKVKIKKILMQLRYINVMIAKYTFMKK